ncbi:MAG: YraN family protein [Bacteroidales bacterium]|nr:YraN family protein [Bacteroidales bacterium]
MSESLTLGQKGELHALKYLQDAGYLIRHRNWTYGKREVDIIAETSDYVVFVEVKTRTESLMERIDEIVNSEKRRSILYVAEAYIKRYEIDKEARFDIIVVVAKGENFVIDHREDAFYPTLR